jgi:mannose/cellobiose epimerase-like protein (N-acyl-D-glucosamine 2-epimerase family)
LKALVAKEERSGDPDGSNRSKVDHAAERVFTYFLAPKPDICGVEVPGGLWIDHLHGDDLSSKVDHIPVSTFYHILFAFMEVTRHRAGQGKFSGLPW